MLDVISKLPENSTQTDTENNTSQKPVDNFFQIKTGVSREQKITSHNVSILESAAVIIGVNDKPLSLVLNSSLEKINEFLAQHPGNLSIQNDVNYGFDINPDATAERIASLSTDCYSDFLQQYPDEDEISVLNRFHDLVSRAVEQGFGEARDILDGLEVLEGQIEKDIDLTYVLLREKLDAFAAMMTDMTT